MKLSWVLIALLALTVISSCKKDDDDPAVEVIAGFTFVVDATNTMMVKFTNTSQNYTSSSWDFGDGETSTEANPTHTYDAEGVYEVKLTVTGAGGTDLAKKDVAVVDANAQLTLLTGGDQKTWKLIRDVSTGRYPLEVAPDGGAIWWAFGLQEDLANRVCMLNDEWIFKANGEMVFDDKGDYWAEGNIFPEGSNNICANSADPMVNVDGVDVSAWSSGTHQWAIEGNELTVTGLGAFIGIPKAATGAEVIVPQESVTYEIISLIEGTTADTLIVQTSYLAGDTPAHWRAVLVHYPNATDEPPIPGPTPTAGFDMSIAGLTVTLTNTSVNGVTYLWDFGDGNTSTEESPTYTYATAGIYNVKLTATNPNGTGEVTKLAFLSDVILTDALLKGGAWKIRLAEKSVFVGPTLGSPDWWSVPLVELEAGGGWACLSNDEFIFSASGVYEYKTNGDARNDGYKAQPAGCFTDAELATQDFPFMSAIHSYTLDTNGERPFIVLTNGESQAAFIGFYKGFYGGENDANSTVPNGGFETNRYEVMGYANSGSKEYLFLSVDLNGAEPDGASWSVILER